MDGGMIEGYGGGMVEVKISGWFGGGTAAIPTEKRRKIGKKNTPGSTSIGSSFFHSKWSQK